MSSSKRKDMRMRVSLITFQYPHINSFTGVVNAHKMKFFFKAFSVNMIKSADSDLVTFAEESFNGKLHFLCSELHNLRQGEQ